MRVLSAAVIIMVGISVAPGIAAAQERLGDGAMGAAAGALVAGPVGAIAGGLVGLTVGPDIAHAWGLRHYHRYHGTRRVTRREQETR